jgi:signal transduction histidine kinase
VPTLTVIQGPDHGRTYEIDGESSIIGRDPGCEVALRDPGASRHHARLELQGGRLVLRDLSSSNGTFVNGVRITEAAIQPGDQVRVGNTILTMGQPLSDTAPVDRRGLPIQVDTEGRVDSSIITTASTSGDPHLAFAGGEDLAEMRASIVGLQALYRIAEMLARDFDIDRLVSGVLDMVFDVVDADRGFVLLKDSRSGAMVAKAVRYREELLEQIRREQAGGPSADTSIPGQEDVGEAEPVAALGEEGVAPGQAGAGPGGAGAGPGAGPGAPGASAGQSGPAAAAGPGLAKAAPICVSRTIINYVMKRGQGVLTTNAMQDRRFEEGESVQDFGIRSAICVPIKSRNEIIGIIHVDTHVSQGQFSADDLKLMTAIGCQTGLAVENANLIASQVQQERLAAVGQAIASLSHYIKNLLQGIQGGSHAVETGLRSQELPTVDKGWEIVSRNLHRINNLVLDMLSYSRQAAPNLTKTSVNAIVREVVALAETAAKEKQVTLVTKLDTTLPEIAVDPDGIHHACLNIVNNAIEAVRPISGRVEITTRQSPHRSEVWITVADNGEGIKLQDQPKIFQAFFSTKGHKGTGLGLAAAQRIIQEHGGRITMNSKPGEGAAFVIHLPSKLIATA